jgi:hypothetical protein
LFFELIENPKLILWHNFSLFGAIAYTVETGFSIRVGRIENPDNPELNCSCSSELFEFDVLSP